MAAVLAAALIAPVAASGGYALATLPDAGWQGGYRLLLWTLIHYAYLLMFLLLAAIVSLRTGSARVALTALLALWLTLCVILPRAASDAAQQLAPTPSYQAVRNQIEQDAPAYETADKWEQRLRALRQASGDKPLLNERAMRLDQSERDSHAIFDRRLNSFYDAVEHQDRTFGMLGMFSPAVALHTAGSALAGTDFHQHRHFIDAAEAYRRGMVNRLNGELMRHAEHSDAGANNNRQFWESIPAFDYRAPALAGVLHNLATPLLLLLGWCAAALLGAWATARKVTP
jgi:ABC-2 type transport system permease protein